MMTGQKSVNASSDHLVNNLEYEVLEYGINASDLLLNNDKVEVSYSLSLCHHQTGVAYFK